MQLIIIMFKNTFDSIEPNLHIHSYIHTHVYMFKHMCMCVIIVFVFFFSRFPVATTILQRNYSAAQQRTGCVQLLRHPLQARHPVRKSMCVCVCVCVYLVFPHCCFQEAPRHTHKIKGNTTTGWYPSWNLSQTMVWSPLHMDRYSTRTRAHTHRQGRQGQ